MSGFNRVIDYAARYQAAVMEMIKDLLDEVAEEGLPGEHFFYITFATDAEGVELSANLREHYSDQMTIVLQNQFWGLMVDEDGFSVTLRFGGAPETLRVPWNALVSFADPSAEFGIELRPGGGMVTEVIGGEGARLSGETGVTDEASETGEETSTDDPNADLKSGQAAEGEPEEKAGEVLSFEAFKKK